MENVEPPAYWKKNEAKLCRRINATLWVEYFSPRFFLISAMGAVLFYAFRRLDINLFWAATLCCLAVGTLTYVSYIKKKGNFFNRKDAFAFLDYQMGLNSSLSAATQGMAKWPDEKKVEEHLRWRSPSLLLWVPAGFVLVIAALVLPLPDSKASDLPGWEKPPTVATMENWLETLEQIKELHQEDVQQMQEKLEEINGRTAEEMYSHAALEAADSLEEQMKLDLQSFAQNMNSLNKALSDMMNAGDDKQSAQFDQKALNNAMEALDAMKEKGLQLSEGCCNKPSEEDEKVNGAKEGNQSEGLKPLTSDQISSMSKEQLQNLQNSLGNIASEMEKLNIREMEGLLCRDGEGGEDGGEGEGKEGAGRGGITRGRGDAPLTLGKEAPELDLQKEGLERDPSAKVLLGEKVGEEAGKHEAADPTGSTPAASGSASNPSSGGQAVWTDQYTPAEREALKNFFK